uniref:Phosphoribosyl-ATP pyrophosphatase n=1 Tax=uncultured Chloroflexota bacterium TaxID=166587 RepID=H5SBG0_9CHLR|nr:phosphoribosyl-ATP pyrophosphohydrolase [uncultured Chloroflexota bacterium]
MKLAWLYELIRERQRSPQRGSYTSHLFQAGLPHIARKVGEESTEVIVAALGESDQRLVEEAADLLYHLLVLLAARQITPAQVVQELERRHARSSIAGEEGEQQQAVSPKSDSREDGSS